jgi:hypothetical protein
MSDSLTQAIAGALDAQAMFALARRLSEIERTFGYQRFRDSAQTCYEQLVALGLEDVRRIELPADGVTAHMDMVMPQAWDATDATLELVEPDGERLPLLDYAAMPLSLANRCAPTPPEGLLAVVITAETLHTRARADGLFVYTQGQHPAGLRAEAVAKGVAGLISDCSPAREIAPDATYWLNGWCSPGWYQTKRHAPLTCFSITPAKGALLAERLAAGGARVFARADTRLYDGTISTVTGLLPGRSEREIVLTAHIYEPFFGDDAIGAAAAIAIVRAIKSLRDEGTLALEYGVRVLIGMERYGFAAYYADEAARSRAALAINLDAICLNPARTGAPIEVRGSPASLPFWGDHLLWPMAQAALAGYPLKAAQGNLSDDTFVSDRTIGVPSQWVWTQVGATHHSSLWFDDDLNDLVLGERMARLMASYVAELARSRPANANAERLTGSVSQGLAHAMAAARARDLARLRDGRLTAAAARRHADWQHAWERGRIASLVAWCPTANYLALIEQAEALHTAWLEAIAALGLPEAEPTLSDAAQRAQGLVYRRASLGMPFSQARIPLEEQITGNHEQALNWMDGQRDLLEIARRVAWETDTPVDDAALERLLAYCARMAQYGYLALGR